MLYLVLVGIFGACMGSFTSMLLHRLPKMKDDESVNLFYPRSSCPDCKNKLSVSALIPIFSYLWQKGVCKFCKKSISPFYLINEIIHCCVVLLIALYVGINVEGLLYYFIFFILYILFFLDYKYLYLPFYLNLTLIPLGILINYLFNTFTTLYLSIGGMIIGYSLLWLVNAIYKAVRSKNGIGGGDFILLAGLGSVFGIMALGPIIFLGSSISIIIYLLTNKSPNEEIPFGSGLIIGAIIFNLLKILIN